MYTCELHDKVIFISNLPQSHADFSLDPKVHIYDANVKVDAGEDPVAITAKTLKTHIVDLVPDEADERVSLWADNPNEYT